MHHGTILDCSEEDFDFSFDLNVKSMHRTIKAFLPDDDCGRRRQHREHLVLRGVAAAGQPLRLQLVEGGGVAAVARGRARLHHARASAATRICPGTVETPSMLDRAAAQGPQGKEMFISRQKMGRLGTADEIASMAVYLGSDESAFTTGVDLVVDGGYML